MQQTHQQPLRPVAQRGPDVPLNNPSLAASLQSLTALRSAFTPLPAAQPAPQLYPEVALFSQFHQLFPGAVELAQQQHALLRLPLLREAELAPRIAGAHQPMHHGTKQLSRDAGLG